STAHHGNATLAGLASEGFRDGYVIPSSLSRLRLAQFSSLLDVSKGRDSGSWRFAASLRRLSRRPTVPALASLLRPPGVSARSPRVRAPQRAARCSCCREAAVIQITRSKVPRGDERFQVRRRICCMFEDGRVVAAAV